MVSDCYDTHGYFFLWVNPRGIQKCTRSSLFSEVDDSYVEAVISVRVLFREG